MKKKQDETVKFSGIDFKYVGVDYDYEHGNHTCTCGDNYCRCGTIESAHVTLVSLQDLVNKVVEGKGLSEVDKYCVDRILSTFKVWDRSLWEVGVCLGYYGEEIGDVTFDKNISAQIDVELSRILALPNTKEKVEALLVLEYGYLLPELVGCDYSLETVDKSKVSAQKGHYSKLDRAIVAVYNEYPHPRGVALIDGPGYRLIDGYHRLAAAKDETVRLIVGVK